MHRRITRAPWFAPFIVALFCSAAVAQTQKNIDMIIPYDAGGGFDLYARAVASVMPKYLSADTRIIPRNMPGGASIKGLTSLYHAPPDGSTIGIVPLPGGLQPQLIGQKVQYDLDQMTWLGLVNVAVYELVVAKDSPFASFKDFVDNRPRVPFISTTGSSDDAMIKIVMSTLNSKAKYLNTYRGGPEAQLAVLRGEADASLSITEIAAPNVASGALKVLAWFQRKGAAGAPVGVPDADDIGHPELASIGLYRVFAAPPGLAPEIRTRLTDAYAKTLGDPEFLALTKKANLQVDPGDAAKTRQLYEDQKAFLSKYTDLLADPGKLP